jgi:hypothetical protein
MVMRTANERDVAEYAEFNGIYLAAHEKGERSKNYCFCVFHSIKPA